MATVLGVDGWKSCWVWVRLTEGRFVEAGVSDHLSGLPPADAIAVDVPIGFVDGAFRPADREAAAWLGSRRTSVFAVPPLAVWRQESYEAAKAECVRLTGSALSRQTYGLRLKVLEANGDHGRDLIEAHPEVSFRALAGEPLAHGKKTWAGQRLRERLLRNAGIELPESLGAADAAPVDDVLDAAAAAWTANRLAAGLAERLPKDAPGPWITY